MANQLHIYYGNISKEGTDGTEASAGTGLSPISVTLDAAKEESKVILCAVRCDKGYHIEGGTTLKLVGANAAKWKLALDEDFGSPRTLTRTATGRIPSRSGRWGAATGFSG